MNRRPIPNVPTDKQEAAFSTLLQYFAEPWMNQKAPHPLRTLWNRKDLQATTELCSFGLALDKLEKVDFNWLKDQVHKVKSLDRNTYSGALNEINSLSIFSNPTNRLQPARKNQPGYDCILRLGVPDKQIRISLKKYGMSIFERDFIDNARKVKIKVLELLKKYKYPPVTVMIDSPTEYPEPKKWSILFEKLDEIFKIKLIDKDPFSAIFTDRFLEWTIIISPTIERKDDLEEGFNSYVLMVTTVFHKNEHLNLRSKLDEACNNLAKHSKIEDDKIRNAILIHLPTLASIQKCKEWLDDYFSLFSYKPISLVLLYQPTIANVSINSNEQILSHYIFPYIREERWNNWLDGELDLGLDFPVGRVSIHPTKKEVVAKYPDGRVEAISSNDRYFYQSGKLYTKAIVTPDGTMTGSVDQIAAGITAHPVFEFLNDGKKMILSGHFAPDDELLIL